MEIDQVHEGGSVSLSSGAPAYAVDGVKIGFVSTGHSTNATLSCQRIADAPVGYTYSVKCTVGTAASAVGNGDYIAALIPIEAGTIQDALLGTSGAQTLCLQWQSKISIGGYIAGWGFQNFAQTRSYDNTAAASSAAVWTADEVCFPGDASGTWVTSGNAGGAYAVLTFAAGSTYQGAAGGWAGGNYLSTTSQSNSLLTTAGSTFEITNLKLEISPAPTPFQRRPIQQELALCQRYYEKSYDIGIAPGTATILGAADFVGAAGYSSKAGLSISYKATKRADPAVTLYAPDSGASGAVEDFVNAVDVAPTVEINGEGGFGWYAVPSSGSNAHFAGQWIADSRL